jgi:hypothetical protein
MTDHVYIDGQRHQVVALESLENLAHPAYDIDLPPGAAGWATTEKDGALFAAWLPAPGEGEAS